MNMLFVLPTHTHIYICVFHVVYIYVFHVVYIYVLDVVYIYILQEPKCIPDVGIFILSEFCDPYLQF